MKGHLAAAAVAIVVYGHAPAQPGRLPLDAAPAVTWTAGAAGASGSVSALTPAANDGAKITARERRAAIHRAQVWRPTDIPSLDLRAGPDVPGAFAPGETVACDFVPHDRSGNTPKFWCRVGTSDAMKVRFGQGNGHVYAVVAATRLFWALGFGANYTAPVRVVCRGCADNPWTSNAPPDQREAWFDPAAIDRRMPGRVLEVPGDEGWSWDELDDVRESAGGATVAQRDALKLLVVLVQHTDNKPENQTLLCEDDVPADVPGEACQHPFMLVTDVGGTFGHATVTNRNVPSSVNFRNWSTTPVWRSTKDGACIGNLRHSATGSFSHPRIGEAGRRFLADLLVQLSDAQLRDLFEVARFPARDPDATVDDWVEAFKQKRDAIVHARCAP